MKDAGETIDDDLFSQALELRGEVAIKRGDRKDAIKHFARLLDDYDGKKPLASVRYRLGRMQFDEGSLAEAETTWKKLSDGKDAVWRRLAQEQMSSEKWRTEYKKYIDRIPAATSMGSRKQ
jgi:predicted Zn-dependent protease